MDTVEVECDFCGKVERDSEKLKKWYRLIKRVHPECNKGYDMCGECAPKLNSSKDEYHQGLKELYEMAKRQGDICVALEILNILKGLE